MELIIQELRTALEAWEKRALISESREERQNKDILILRKQISDFQSIQAENENLVKIVREMKKSISWNNDLNTISTSSTSPTSAARTIEIEKSYESQYETFEKEFYKKLQLTHFFVLENQVFGKSFIFSYYFL